MNTACFFHPSLAAVASPLWRAYETSSIVNKGITVLLLLMILWAALNSWGKFEFLKCIERRIRRTKKDFKNKTYPAQLFLEKNDKFEPGCPITEIYRATMKQLLLLLRQRGVVESDILGWASGPAPYTLSETEVDTIRSIAESEMERQLLLVDDKMSAIATCASIAPSIGLFGTVLGIIEAFMSMTTAGNTAIISNVAPGIAGALLTTLLGLFIAIPTTAFFNALTVRVRKISVEVQNFTDQLVADLASRHLRPAASPTPLPAPSPMPVPVSAVVIPAPPPPPVARDYRELPQQTLYHETRDLGV